MTPDPEHVAREEERRLDAALQRLRRAEAASDPSSPPERAGLVGFVRGVRQRRAMALQDGTLEMEAAPWPAASAPTPLPEPQPSAQAAAPAPPPAPAANPFAEELGFLRGYAKDMLSYMERRDQALFSLIERIATPAERPPAPAARDIDSQLRMLCDRLESALLLPRPGQRHPAE